MTLGQQEQIIAYYVAGWPLSKIAAHTGLTLKEIHHAITPGAAAVCGFCADAELGDPRADDPAAS